jgi:hypothetical protein
MISRWDLRQIESFKQRYPTGRVVVLADQHQLAEMVPAFRAGANAYLVNVATCEAFIKSLELVMLGVTFLPPEILALISYRRSRSRNARAADNHADDGHADDDGIEDGEIVDPTLERINKCRSPRAQMRHGCRLVNNPFCTAWSRVTRTRPSRAGWQWLRPL